jgi:membrane protease YdiL (CAAX protease family)
MLNLVGGGVSENQQSLNRLEQGNAGLFKILVVFIAPFCEETIFRGMFFNIFFTKPTTLNKWLGIITSGFLFGYMHDPMLSKIHLGVLGVRYRLGLGIYNDEGLALLDASAHVL